MVELTGHGRAQRVAVVVVIAVVVAAVAVVILVVQLCPNIFGHPASTRLGHHQSLP